MLEMQAVIAGILKIEADCVSVKATTTEGLGFVGREEGVMAYATVLIEKDKLLVLRRMIYHLAANGFLITFAALGLVVQWIV